MVTMILISGFMRFGLAETSPDAMLKDMSLEQKVSQIIMSYPPLSKTDPIEVGAIILTGNLLKTEQGIKDRVTSVTSRATTPLFIAADVEGGTLNKFKFDTELQDLPANGQITSPEEAYLWGQKLGHGMQNLGINMALSPVLDVADSGMMFEKQRSFVGSPTDVAKLGVQYCKGLAESNIVSIGKHWPGYGNIAENSDHTFIITDRSKAQIAKDQQAFIQTNTALTGVMLANVGYTEYGSVPAILSPQLVKEAHDHGWLTITDDLSVKALAQATDGDQVEVIRQAFLAGNDFLLTTAPLDWEGSLDYRGTILTLIQEHPEHEAILDAAVLRILTAKQNAGLLK